MRELIHWRKAQIVRAAARNLERIQPECGISWAVITRRHVDPDVPGWDYHLVRTDWGYEHAVRLQQQVGGWILTLRKRQFHIWSLLWALRYPKRALLDQIKWRNRPAIGDTVEDCRGQIRKVVGFAGSEDDLVLDDGSHASWMHCCDYPTEKTVEREAEK